jgi:hypothetical protein
VPLFLLPFLVLAIGNTRMHKRQADAAQQEANIHEKEYQLLLAEHNAKYHVGLVHPVKHSGLVTVRRATPVATPVYISPR